MHVKFTCVCAVPCFEESPAFRKWTLLSKYFLVWSLNRHSRVAYFFANCCGYFSRFELFQLSDTEQIIIIPFSLINIINFNSVIYSPSPPRPADRVPAQARRKSRASPRRRRSGRGPSARWSPALLTHFSFTAGRIFVVRDDGLRNTETFGCLFVNFSEVLK